MRLVGVVEAMITVRGLIVFTIGAHRDLDLNHGSHHDHKWRAVRLIPFKECGIAYTHTHSYTQLCVYISRLKRCHG